MKKESISSIDGSSHGCIHDRLRRIFWTRQQDSSAATEESADSSAAAEDGEAVELVVGGVTSSSAKDAVTYFGEKGE